jgi:hypothetical protein
MEVFEVSRQALSDVIFWETAGLGWPYASARERQHGVVLQGILQTSISNFFLPKKTCPFKLRK